MKYSFRNFCMGCVLTQFSRFDSITIHMLSIRFDLITITISISIILDVVLQLQYMANFIEEKISQLML